MNNKQQPMNSELDGLSFPLEDWKPIEGYEGLYSISNLGRVFSHKRHRYLRPIKDTNGYLRVNLCKESKVKKMLVHRLVLSAFSPRGDSDRLECNHKNGKKDDNRLVNLEFVTRSENQRHSVDVLGNNHGSTRKAVAQYSTDGTLLKVFRSISDAKRETGVHTSHICSVAKGHLMHAKGYIWKYLSDLTKEEEKLLH